MDRIRLALRMVETFGYNTVHTLKVCVFAHRKLFRTWFGGVNFVTPPKIRKSCFSTPNTTAMQQPLDAVIIASLKCRYRRSHIYRALDLEDAGHRDLYNFHQLQATEWICNACNSLGTSLIQNCSLHAKLVVVAVNPLYDSTVLYNVFEFLFA